MSRPLIHHRVAGIRRRAGVGLAGLALLAPLAAAAAPTDGLVPPPASLFRSLQLTTLACGRDNDATSCDKARAMADPLLDHQRLSASCKDTLWAIREKAVVAPTNTPERRDGIDRAAKDVTVLCRQPVRPTSTTPAPGNGASPFFNAPKSR
jgi:hypothetical protein